MFTLPAYPTPIPSACASQIEWAQDPWAVGGNYTLFSAGRPVRIVFGPQICLGLLLLSVDPEGRFDSLNPYQDVPALEGAAVLAYTHELGHATLATQDETAAECYAMAHHGDLLTAVPAARRGLIERSVVGYDGRLPAAYHAHAC